MRIIDIFNKIANGEEVPKKIKYNGHTYEYYRRLPDISNYKNITSDSYFSEEWFIEGILNDEVEVIEEKPEFIEHIYTGDRYLFSSKDNGITKEDRKQLDSYFRVLLLSHDALVNAVNYLLEKEK